MTTNANTHSLLAETLSDKNIGGALASVAQLVGV